ncbi:probable serine/threonine-protein kinase MARK-A [Anopheles merus]|uniref:probable serine/threonine-protein kinase MARK-A n=1 Tax=Anopheles merus TaxID=30066 RepID=UPI001BE44075|nr:probable serine/threonine-protein kinase MARK-A [Anopheles merus]XP_041776545.1 probable serine/threonine-protein kinase MARK-A [Anopheles merus]XP_041776546.1 probable serine/threonine-protein kinase MARK-A [Anopheles merus]XP_041776547.1 probable serine/threonine-protein kinase MARK-A [Anopheles merus]XP_041776548.1 probable serine/threonine-protein kinase MARK-A [Anopheles merus]XP_041776549.1 probable serine/threonine-protein kinase MARK-A [Anopheles merus]XP_041776550.1 probable serin
MEQGILASAVPTPKTPIYQRYTTALQNDPRCSQEVALGRRIGLYRFCGDIGRGNFSRVKLAVHQLTKDKVAIKVVDTSRLDAKALRMLSREVSTLECVYHPFILRLFEVIETLGKIHLISEWVQGGELYNRITEVGPLKEPHAALLFQQLLLAVKHLHSLGFVHRDIKAENVLLVSEERIKLADFGFSTQLVNGPWQHLDTFCGSPPYAAPELFSDDHYIGGPVDIWALGILLYFMLEGSMPFKAPTVPLLRTAVLKGEFVISTSLSVPCCRVIQRILVHTPSRRPTIEQLLDCQWFRYAQDHAGRLGRSSNQPQTTVGQTRNPNNVPRRRRKKLFWFFPSPRDRLSSPDSTTSSRDNNLSAANNNQHHRHHHHHHQHNSQRHQPMSSSTKSSSSRDERLVANPPEIPNLRTIACSTKRAASVLEENYLHPLKPDPAAGAPGEGADTGTLVTEHHLHHSHFIKDLSNDVSNNNIVNSNANGTNNYTNQLTNDATGGANGSRKESSAASQERKPRRFSFGRSLKKRIGPMELVSAESLTGPDGGVRPPRAVDLREKLHRTIDEEHGRFVMYPTTAVSSEGNRHLHPLETETRRLMKVLGITGDMIARAVTNGPRSDIIGVYRIVMHRLQREQTNARLASTNGGAYEFLELKSINGTTTSGCSSGRSGPNNGAGRSTANSRRHIDQNRGRICAIL